MYEESEFGKLQRKSKHTMLLGAFTLVATVIEDTLENLLVGLIESNQRHGGAAIRWISTQQQIILIKKIIKDIYGEESVTHKMMKMTIDNAQKALEYRNHYIHAIYHYLDNELKQSVHFARGQFEPDIKDVDLDQMKKDLEESRDFMIDFCASVIARSLPFPSPLPNKQIGSSQDTIDTGEQNQNTQTHPPESSP